MLYQVRNWYNFTWLSGDFNVEQAIHSIDKMLWSFGDKVPLSAWGNGGRMVRVEYPGAGDIYDSMAVTFDFGEGRTGYMFCRQINKCYNETADHFIGTKGYAATVNGGFGGCTVNVKGQEPIKIKNQGDMYVIEHQFLFKAIKGDIPFRNDLYYTANSTMAGILARQVCRTGKRFTWQEALDYQEPMRPEGFDPEGKLFVTEGEGENAAKVLKQTDYTPDTVPPTVPDEHGRYKVEIAGGGYLYHEVKR
ncbi:hypothetical protein FACS189454_10380 [Planctomycetales bacterium]|nr:hypothetical protein FACS189454_10380 [Planctomycetales bacterium]